MRGLELLVLAILSFYFTPACITGVKGQDALAIANGKLVFKLLCLSF
ncbi:hypothetical protein COO91_02306 [Nostoc flagelliforme CCNUN1]|uniref:Uncharacterized protein n=2 Tax=Nostoc flagelliforme TaxID=1306274 RepID=A0A2K8SLP9_9NOSO|nr:hypothetical protein COO91_02306 [Nostoc flagelliforme CCNUN1]